MEWEGAEETANAERDACVGCAWGTHRLVRRLGLLEQRLRGRHVGDNMVGGEGGMGVPDLMGP